MAPVAVDTFVQINGQTVSHSPSVVKAPALVIGSPSSAFDGSYQSLISDLESTRQVEKQMVDRLLEGGQFARL